MKIADRKVDRIVIKHGQSIVGILTDDMADMAPGYTAELSLDTRPGKDAVAFAGDVLYYQDSPDDKYIVTQADDRFFTMVPVTVDKKHNRVDYDNLHHRIYPNNIKVGTLMDYGIILEFRGDDKANGYIEKN